MTTTRAGPLELELWTVYESPADFPGWYVARRFVLDQPTEDVLKALSLEALRNMLPPGLYRLPRMPADDPVILEVWL